MIRLISFLALAFTLPALASAQNDGELSTTQSTASMTYTLNVIEPLPRIQISGLEDLNFDYNIGGASAPAQSLDICVYITDDTATLYDLQLQADPLTDTNTNYPYTFTYEDNLVQSPVELSGTVTDTTFDQTQAGFTASTDQNCSSGDRPARLTVALQSDPTVATSSSASAQMRFTVSPN